jgi:hypothetical protein
VRHTAQRLDLQAGSTVLHCAQGEFMLILAAGDRPRYPLEAGDTLHIDVPPGTAVALDIEPGPAGAALIDVRIAASISGEQT